jgi:hypothetical protein
MDSTKLAHTLAHCLENPGGVRDLIKKIKSIGKKKSEFGECINKSLGEH